MLQAAVVCLLLSSANCIRLGKERRYTNNVPASNDDLRQECEGKTQHWSSEGGVRRLEGPAFFFHVNHHNGRELAFLARNRGGYRTRAFTRWSDVDAVKAGRTITEGAAKNGYQNDSMFKDKSWTDIEDTFEDHTLDDLGCGSISPRIFVTSARHPVENLLSREAFLQTKTYGLMGSCESDNIALRFWAGNICGNEQHHGCRALTRRDLEIAKARARKMDAIFILDHPVTKRLGCTRLGWMFCPMNHKHETYSSDILDQLDNQSWAELFERNKLGIEFYDYLKQLSFDMLQEDGIPLPTQGEQDQALSVLRSLQDAKASAVPYIPAARRLADTSSTRWQCGR
jgi:hypothetical protein